MKYISTLLLITMVIISYTVKAADPFKAHNEIHQKNMQGYAVSAQLTMRRYIQQGQPVPPIPFLPPHAQLEAQRHNARLTTQPSATPQPNAAPVQQQDERLRQVGGGCAQQ